MSSQAFIGCLALATLVAVCACSSSGGSSSTGSGGASTGGSGMASGGGDVGGSSASGGSGGLGGTSDFGGAGGGVIAGSSGIGGVVQCPGGCDDGLGCTVDACVAGKCQHTIGPNSGATACPLGQYCTAAKGCVAAPPCATTTDCTTAWAGDACKSNIRCDAASSVCLFDVLDKDKDGHAPVICGGDDCNDSDATIHPGAPEICNGKDDNCNGIVDDEPATDASCSNNESPPLHICQNGSCACAPANSCPGVCVDKKSTKVHCGDCNTVCFGDDTCVNGLCVCTPPRRMVCGNACVWSNDSNNCGTCGNKCATGEICNSENAIACVCPTGQKVCAGACVDTSSDVNNCGGCGNACPATAGTAVCALGTCSQTLTCPRGFGDCDGNAANGCETNFLTTTDNNNCGACGRVCDYVMLPSGQLQRTTCCAGTCLTSCP